MYRERSYTFFSLLYVQFVYISLFNAILSTGMIFVKEKGEGNILHIKGLPQNVFLRVSAPAAAITALPIAAISIPAFTLVFTIPARAHNPDRGGTPGRPSSHDPGAQA